MSGELVGLVSMIVSLVSGSTGGSGFAD